METKTKWERITLQTKNKKELGSKGKPATVANQKQETQGLSAENGELREESPASHEVGEKEANPEGCYTQVLDVPVSLSEKCGGLVASYFVNTGLFFLKI